MLLQKGNVLVENLLLKVFRTGRNNDAFSGQDYFPEILGRQTFYDPPDRGFEREIRKRLEYWAKLRRERSS